MSVLTQEVSSVETAWNEWLLSLDHWDRRSVYPHELEWLDRLISGEWEWDHVMQAFGDLILARRAT